MEGRHGPGGRLCMQTLRVGPSFTRTDCVPVIPRPHSFRHHEHLGAKRAWRSDDPATSGGHGACEYLGVTNVAINEVLAILERDRARHLTADPLSEWELDQAEQALGLQLPREFRIFLAHLGGGILYEAHEVFGPRRLMVHDIELVPDFVSFRRHFIATRSEARDECFLPFHRAGGLVHGFDLSEKGEPGVHSLDRTRSYPSLAHFLQAVVLPSPSTPGREARVSAGLRPG